MSTEAAAPPAASPNATVKSGGVTITRETITPDSQPQGAQGIRPAPAGTIPPPLKAVSETTIPKRGDGPARKAMLEDLHKRAKPPLTHELEERKAAAAKAKAPAVQADDEMADGADDESTPPVEETNPEASTATEQKKKVNPWKLVDEHKAARAKLEAEVADLKKSGVDSAAIKQQLAEIEQVRARNTELEGAIALLDARKTEKFQSEYQKPYEKAWQKSMQDLRSLQVEDAKSGEQRAITPNDLLRVVNISDDVEAREMAKEMFGDDDYQLVMRKREVIRDLYDKQQEYLDDVAKNGSNTIKQNSEQDQKFLGELQKTWDTVSNELVSTERMKPYFAPIDGDEKATQKLEEGYKFVDEAMAKNPRDPKLTAEERAKVVKAHAAVRHKAAAFTRLTYMIAKERAATKAALERLSQYEETEPQTASGVKTPAANNGGRVSAWDAIRADLYKLSEKPGRR